MIKACVFGTPLNVGNRGVLALGASIAGLLSQSSDTVAISFFYGSASGGTTRLQTRNGALTVGIRNCRMSPRSRPSEHILIILAMAFLYRIGIRGPAARNPWLRDLLDADFIGEIRGGDSFSDIYGFRRFFERNLPLLSVVLLGRPYVMLPQTYGPFRRPASRATASFILRKAAAVLTRDRNCEGPVFDLCGRAPRFCPDVAFTLEPVEPASLELSPAGLDWHNGELVVGVNVSGLLYTGGYTGKNMFGLRSDYGDLMRRLVAAILDSTRARVLLVPHVFGSEHEEEACAALASEYQSRYPGRVFRVTQPLDQSEIKWVIGRTDFFVGARMHACIAALSQFVPTVGMAYSDKFLGVFESAGVGTSLVDLRTKSTEDVIAEILSALDKRATLRDQLRVQIPVVRELVFRTFRDIVPTQAVDSPARVMSGAPKPVLPNAEN